MARSAALLATGVALAVLAPTVATAHPLGNFTVNTFSGVIVSPAGVSIDFVLDMAEIPAYQAKQAMGVSADGRLDQAHGESFRSQECQQILGQVSLRLDERATPLKVAATSLSFPAGQAGLTTLRLTCTFTALAALGKSTQVAYASSAFADRVGWREITAVGDGMTLTSSDVPRDSPSNRLTRYPANLLQSPLDQRQASLAVRAGGPRLPASPAGASLPSGLLPRGVDQATQAFTSFVGRQHFTTGFALLAIALAALLGAIHAFAPGHGKTVMAAYLVGQRGSLRQAAVIALTVTLTHTAGVLALGIAISASFLVAPERLYPWLGLASGLILVAIGSGIFLRMFRLHSRGAVVAHDGHSHAEGSGDGLTGVDAGHDHGHHPHSHPELEPEDGAEPGTGVATLRRLAMHSHGGRAHSHGPAGQGQGLSWASLLGMGFVGGFLPSPSAVVVLLGAIALGRTWFGVLLVVAYGLGMAATLTGAGLVLLYARGALDRRLSRARRHWLADLSQLVPLATATVIVAVGAYLAVRAAAQI
ncbi:MAG: hypothetical protein NVSMB32_10780 [Actinomycetota bacterium]